MDCVLRRISYFMYVIIIIFLPNKEELRRKNINNNISHCITVA